MMDITCIILKARTDELSTNAKTLLLLKTGGGHDIICNATIPFNHCNPAEAAVKVDFFLNWVIEYFHLTSWSRAGALNKSTLDYQRSQLCVSLPYKEMATRGGTPRLNLQL